jgi:hypothetical protein
MTTDDDDPYGRNAAFEAALAARAEQAARDIAAREQAQRANVDPQATDLFDQLVAERVAYYLEHGIPDRPADHNPLDPYLIDWPEFWATEHDDTEWLLEPLFADGRSHALYAGAKTGKSYLVLAACAALANGRKFLEHASGEPVHILYLDYEMSPQDVRERLEEFGYGPDDDLTHLHYALLPSLPPLDTEAGGQALLTSATALNARFVIIDTTSRSIAGDENDADTLRAFYRCTGLLLKQAGIGWARLDHAGKDATKGQRGTSAKNDDVDIVCRLERTDAGQKIIATHRRMSWYPEKTEINVVELGGTVTFTNADGPSYLAGTADVVADLERLGVAPGASNAVCRDALKAAGLGRNNKLIASAVKFRKAELIDARSDGIEDLDNATYEQAVGRGTRRGTLSEASRERNEGTGGNAPESSGERLGERSGTVADATGERSASLQGMQSPSVDREHDDGPVRDDDWFA